MTNYLIQDTSLTAIADEVRSIADTENAMNTGEMVANLQSANAEIATQESMLEEALALLETKTTTITENCTLSLTLADFGSRIIVVVYTYVNDQGQIATAEQEYHAEGTFEITTLKSGQILFMGVDGIAPIAYNSSGPLAALRSFSDGLYYYAYCFATNGNCSITFTY